MKNLVAVVLSILTMTWVISLTSCISTLLELTITPPINPEFDLSCITSSATPEESKYFLQFDGVDGQVTIPNASELNPIDEITIAMWIRLEEAIDCEEHDYARGVIVKGFPNELGVGYHVRVSCDGALEWAFGTANGLSLFGTGETLQVDTWTFLTFVYDGTSDGTAIYFDGIENLSGVFDPDQIGSGSLVAHGSDLLINLASSEEHPEMVNFPGSIYDISLWNVALNPTAIGKIKREGITGTESCLLGYWSCNAGSGTTLADQVSGNDGTMNGGVGWVEF